ncbi:MAG: hypothetical protein QOJ43_358, partial [Gaiellaceae bacterium]|nr:hypothetical protein [Gaiellaceae bacterium]
MAAEAPPLFRHEYADLSLQELLAAPASALLGVSEEAAHLLDDDLEIRTVFDLGSAWIFRNAQLAAEASSPESPSGRAGLVPGDWLRTGASWSSIDAIGHLPVEDLRGLEQIDAAALRGALDVTSIRDFAYWPPRVAAEQTVRLAFGGDGVPPAEEGAELRPRFGEYPTERVYYPSLVMLQMASRGKLTPLKGPIPLRGLFDDDTSDAPAIGALLTLSQSWYAQGITLGHLLHCLALAPGEATRVAIVDWSRRTQGRTEEEIAEAERVDSATEHSRAISEVQDAVARELQRGGSQTFGLASSASEAHADTSSSGLLGAIFGGGSTSDTSQAATSFGLAASVGWSRGNRSIVAGMAQDVNDRTEQHSTGVRNRRASAVSEVSESEHARASTRVVANYNHMHALTVQYYEVVQVYRTVTQLHRAERVLFLPLEIPRFTREIVERNRGILLRAALDDRIGRLLADPQGSVAVLAKSRTPLAASARDRLSGTVPPRSLTSTGASRWSLRGFAATGPDVPSAAGAPPGQATLAAAPPGTALSPAEWESAAFDHLSRVVGRPLLREGSDALHLPPEAEIRTITVEGADVSTVQLDRSGAGAVALDPAGGGTFRAPAGTTLADIDAISLKTSDGAIAPPAARLLLDCAYGGTAFTLPVSVDLTTGTAFQRAVLLNLDAGDRYAEIVDHLNSNHAYYAAIITRALGAAAVTRLLAGYEWNGRPLVEQIEPVPIGVIGNYLVLRAPVEVDEPSGITAGDDKVLAWGDVLQQRGIEFGQHNERLVPIPTEGVFAEAVLGRSNAAEPLDITRFWNWQDSPIPFQPTELVPPSTASRADAQAPVPGQLGQPVLNLVNPTALPDPAGVNSVLTAISNGSIFRDMSGLAGTQQLAQAGMGRTLDAATQAGQLAAANLKTEAQKQVAMGQILGDVAKSLLGGGGGGGGKGSAGISGVGAKINYGKDLDSRRPPSADSRSQAGGRVTGSSGGATGGSRSDGSRDGASGGSTSRQPGVPVNPGTPGGAGGAGGDGIVWSGSGFSREAAYTDTAAMGFSPE